MSLEGAAVLASRARGRAKIVALIVDAEDETVQEINRVVAPDMFQAHGSETPDRVAAISRLTGKPVIKVIKVGQASDVAIAQDYSGKASMILFDAKAPETLVAPLPGGNGVAFDWALLQGFEEAGKFMLSGGLNPDNVAEAIGITGAPIVDVASGVESAPGIKDVRLIRKFIEAAKSAG